jgi:aspartate/methionine/tyrosine aminotransferase
LPAVRTDEQWALAFVEQDGVLVHPGYFFDLRGATYAVVSLLPRPDVFREAVRRLAARVTEVLG